MSSYFWFDPVVRFSQIGGIAGAIIGLFIGFQGAGIGGAIVGILLGAAVGAAIGSLIVWAIPWLLIGGAVYLLYMLWGLGKPWDNSK